MSRIVCIYTFLDNPLTFNPVFWTLVVARAHTQYINII
jgi:hypothetical protein